MGKRDSVMVVFTAGEWGRYTAQSLWKCTVLQISAAHSQPLLKNRASQVSAEYHNTLSFCVLSKHYATFSQSGRSAAIWCLILPSYFIYLSFISGNLISMKHSTAEYSL